MMNKKEFLKTAGLAGFASMIPFGNVFAGAGASHKTNSCTLIPSETAGPYPFDLSGNTAMYRQDIREGNNGLQLNLKLKFIGANNCLPMNNLRVDVWHCNKDGYYSEYANQPGYLGTQSHLNETFFRGIQMTDANGEVNFITILPGWYTSRVCHIHFQVFLSSVLQATSQFTFPEALKNSIYSSNSLYSAHGVDGQTIANDNVFSDGVSYQTATLTLNTSTGGYDSYLEITINGSGTTGLQNLEPETGGQFKLGQNFPNPYSDETNIPFTLFNDANVTIELFDLQTKKVAEVKRNNLSAGKQNINININSLGIAGGNYIYQITVETNAGVFRQCKMMTANN
jgi:protocatechuate 3,4-dioxygenase beta subunit